jgi:hypothetical protein
MLISRDAKGEYPDFFSKSALRTKYLYMTENIDRKKEIYDRGAQIKKIAAISKF